MQEKIKTPNIKNCYRNYCAAGNFIDAPAEAMKANIKRGLGNYEYFCALKEGGTYGIQRLYI